MMTTIIFVLTAPSWCLTEEAVLSYCKEHLAGYKIPRTNRVPGGDADNAEREIAKRLV